MDVPPNPIAEVAGRSLHLALREGHVLKSVLDFTQVAFSELLFRVTNKGLFMSADNRTTDRKESMLCTLVLPRRYFEIWLIPQAIDQDDEAEILIPVDAGNFRNLTNGILKKDIIILWVDADNAGYLNLEIQNIEKQRRCAGQVRLIDVSVLPEHVLKPVLPFAYDMNRPNATVASRDFQKACKAGTQLKADTVRVTAYPTSVTFSVSNAECSKSFPFGLATAGQKVIYEGDFDVKRTIAAVAKCCTMTTDVRVYCSGRNPMLIAMNASESGTFDIYLVPNPRK